MTEVPNASPPPTIVVIERSDFDRLFGVLGAEGYTVVGPTLRDQAIVYDKLASAGDLPHGWTDEQDGGKYRLHRRGDDALFGYAVGPHSWKKFLFPPELRLWSATRHNGGFEVEPGQHATPKYAFLGVRACELHAIQIQDRVFMGNFTDPFYRAVRDGALIIAVNCSQAGGTCFCVSMNAGPDVRSGYDIALTEIIDSDRHFFVAESGTEAGGRILDQIPRRPASDADLAAARNVSENTRAQMGRAMDTRGIKDLLYRNYEHPRWEHVAERCLSCANCTMVCPTCFCSTVEDVTDLTGEHAERKRVWDSCFHVDFSYIVGGNIRPTVQSRYRQWMTHKLATWFDQFGTSGCVGCGRCITWCPVAIDITEEVRVIRESEPDAPPSTGGEVQ